MPRAKQRTPELRDALLRNAVEVLERDGPAGFGVRTVAAAGGTSVAGLYELYGDKAGLVRAMFLDGFQSLYRCLASLEATGDARADLVGLLAATRAFALERPMLFEVMYARPFCEFIPDDDDRRAAVGIYQLIVDAVARWLAGQGSVTDSVDAAQGLVCANRGLVAAELAGVLGRSPASVERRWWATIAALLDGLANTGRD